MNQTARELLRAIRGDLSQVAFSRVLGYRSNAAADWESGRRCPTAMEALRAAERRNIDVSAAFDQFSPRIAHLYAPATLAPWLDALRGAATNRAVASHSGFSEHRVGRWLRGAAKPRLHEFLRLVDAMTDRVSDWVAALVPIDEVPSLADSHAARMRARRLVFERPWTPAVLAQLGVLQPHPSPAAPIAGSLGLDESEVAEVLEALTAAGIAARRRGGLEVVAPLTIDARAGSDDLQVLRRHWAGVSAARLGSPGDDDRFSYNVFNLSAADLAEVRELQSGLYRQIVALAARSAPKECVAMWIGHLVVWTGPEP